MSDAISRESEQIKQVIVVRHDLHMRMGKAIAQGGHAAMMFLFHRMLNGQQLSEDEGAWLMCCGMKKICVRVESAEELDSIEAQCRAAGIQVFVVTDSGLTEFHGIPTKTCLAIGPASEDKINAITGSLKLL